MTSALAGIKVVDLSAGVAGPVAAMLLADFGADVLKVERPSGDPGRTRAGFAMWNRNKRGMTIDVDSAEGRHQLDEIMRCADMCIASDGAGSVSSAVDPEAAIALNPALVFLELPAFLGSRRWLGGQESAGALLALTGLSLRQSSSDGGPVESVFPYILYLHGVLGALAGMSALIERHRSEHGQVVTVGGVHAAMVASTGSFVIDPEAPEVAADFGPAGPNAMYSWYRCQDEKYIFLATLTPKFERAAIEVLGLNDVLADPRISGDCDSMLLAENRGWVRERFEAVFVSRTSADWLKLLHDADVPVGPVLDRESWWASPLIDSLQMRATLDDPERGKVIMPANPINLLSTPAIIESPAPPRGVNCSDQLPWSEEMRPARAPTSDLAPLAGFRVLDLGAILAGPYAGTLLAELGADVVKVEVIAGDSWRQRGMPFIRGQRGLAIDLQSEGGAQAFRQLVASADVVLDNYRSGVLQRLKVDYEHLRQVKSDIISVSITGYGHDPAYASEPAFDALMQATSGMLSAQGGEAGPVLTSVPINDVTAAALGALTATLALYSRLRTGSGQQGWLALASTAALAQCEELVHFEGRPPVVEGGLDYRGSSPLDRCYATSDGWVRLIASESSDLDGLRRAGLVTVPEALDDAHLTKHLERIFVTMTRDEIVTKLFSAGVPSVPVRRLAEVVSDPDYEARETFNVLHRDGVSPLLVPGRYFWFSRTQHHRVLEPPGVGEHTAELLMELGYDADEVNELVEARAIRVGGRMTHRSLPVYR